jgi:hypothetical protein
MLALVQFALYTVGIQLGSFSVIPLLRQQLSFRQFLVRVTLMAVTFGAAFWLSEYRTGGRRIGAWPPVGFRRQVISKVLYTLSCYAITLLGCSIAAFKGMYRGRIAMSVVACAVAALVWGRGVAVYRQLQRDHLANSILQSGETGFVLLLRPFHTIGNLDVTDRTPLSVGQIFDRPVSFAPVRGVDMETHICAALDGEPVIALGWDQPIVGAGKIETSDENWFDVFTELARRADTILLLPLGGTGTTAELGWLVANQQLSKVVFVCPQSESQSIAAAWEETRRALQDRWGPRLPPHVASGGLFRLAAGDEKPIAHYFSSFSEEEVRRAIQSVTGRQIPASHPVAGVK